LHFRPQRNILEEAELTTISRLKKARRLQKLIPD
jgi:hypothetical protein